MKSIITVLLCAVISLMAHGVSAENYENFYRPTGRQINDIAFDTEYVWCATNDGLLRWNKADSSYRFFTTDDGLPSFYTTAVAVDSNKIVWVGTQNGVARLDGDTFTMFQMDESGKAHNIIHSLFVDEDGNIWCGTFNRGVLCFDGDDWTSYTTENSGLASNNVGIIEGNNGVIWISYWDITSPAVLSKFDGTSWTHYSEDNSDLPSNNITDIEIADDNTLWLSVLVEFYEGTYGYVPVSFDGANWERYYTQNVNDIQITDDGTVWVLYGSYSEKPGIRTFDGEQWTNHTEIVDLLPDNIVKFSALQFDEEGLMWFVANISQYDYILLKYDSVSFTEYTIEGPISYNFNDMAVDSNNKLWFASDAGVVTFDGTIFENITFNIDDAGLSQRYSDMLKKDAATLEAVEIDNIGIVWIGTRYGIRSFDGGSWDAHFFPLEKMGFNLIYDIKIDNNNVKWFVTEQGLVSYNGELWETFDGEHYKGLKTMDIDANRVFWFASNGKFLSFDGTEWKEYTEENSPIRGYLYNVVVDHDNVKWFGTSEGLWSYDGSTWNDYTEKVLGKYSAFNGFKNIITVDFNNVKWFAANGTLFSFDGTEWKKYDSEETGDVNKVVINDDIIWVSGSKNLQYFNKNDIPRVGVAEEDVLPAEIAITGNYPNPFNPSTTIEFSLPETGIAELAIYNIMGQKIRTLVSSELSAGSQNAVWDGLDDIGNAVSSGVYISRLKMGDRIAVNRMLLMK